MRRREGTLLPLEVSILGTGLELRSTDQPEFHGFRLAKELRDRDEARRLTAHGTLYKALDRMERAGLLESRWEDPDLAAAGSRPRRRLYRVTGAGEQALHRAELDPVASTTRAIGQVPT
jgi:PadR family transcriptional regulator PadR